VIGQSPCFRSALAAAGEASRPGVPDVSYFIIAKWLSLFSYEASTSADTGHFAQACWHRI